MRSKHYVVACLAGGGIGPELMAEASRALAEVSRQHSFHVEELHVPFGGEAVARHGHPLPAATRAAYRRADAILVAATREPALDGVKADLDLTWRIMRVHSTPAGDLAVVSPLVDDAAAYAVERAFQLARARRGQVATVAESQAWRALVTEALPLLVSEPRRFCVLVAEPQFAQALSDMAAFGRNGSRIVASGRLSPEGPGLFGPTHGSAPDIAGQGVANPSGMLLAAALMLGEGLGERAAAKTLERAVSAAIAAGVRTADLVEGGVGATTRSFMDTVLELLPRARTDTEFFVEAAS